MEKFPMCRICLVEDVRMFVVVNKNLHELYEKLTDVPFATEDRRPMLACFFCCTKLKQCYRFLRQCLETEEVFTQMMNGDYKQNPLKNPGYIKHLNGFSNGPIELISIVDGGQTESDAIKEELPDVSERLDDAIDPEEEHQTDKFKLVNVYRSYTDVADTPALHAESDSKDVLLIEIKTEVVDDQESIEAAKLNLDTLRPNPRATISAEQTKNENNRKMSCVSKIIKKTHNHTSKQTTTFKDPLTQTQDGFNSIVNNTAFGTSCSSNSDKDDIECRISKKGVDSDNINRYRRVCVTEKRFKCDICQRSFSKNSILTRHTRTHTGEKPFKCDICQRSFREKGSLVIHTRTHTGEKPFKCDICHRGYSIKRDLTRHIRKHTGEKPFKCDICQRSFQQKHHLKTHIHIHSDEKPFKCDMCPRGFNQKSHLTNHIRIHTGETFFKCNVCQNSFNCNKGLQTLNP